MDSSDIDYIYEVGPRLVREKRFLKKALYFDVTSNPGFYTFCDEKGGYLYPMSLQSMFAPVIHAVKQVASLEKTSATLPSITLPHETLQHFLYEFRTERNEMENYNQFRMQHNQIRINEDSVIALNGMQLNQSRINEDSVIALNRMQHNQQRINEDSVIALKCQKWPKDIWKKFKKRKLGHVNLQQLKGDLICVSILASNLSLIHYVLVLLIFITKFNNCYHKRKKD